MWRAKVRIFQAEGISMQRLWDGATLSVCDEHQKDEFGLSGVSEKEMITSMYETTEWISCVYVVASGLNIIALCYLFIKHTCMFSHSIMPQFFVTPMDYSMPGSSVYWIFPGKNTGMGCHLLLQGIFLTQGSNTCLLCLLHWQGDSLPLNDLRSPKYT